jgi:Spy/CpxP family protein refolding chaperone
MIASARQRARRALRWLSLTAPQAEQAGRLLREDRRQLEATRELLEECRRHLSGALAAPAPDSTLVLELAVQERLLEKRERELAVRLEESLATLLRPDQAKRLRSLPPEALGDMLGRICA